MQSLGMLLRSRALTIPKRGLWSVLTIRSLQPSTNILALSTAQATPNDSPSVEDYPASVGVVKRGSHSQYCWRSRYPNPSLLQSVCRQVLRLVSNVCIPCFARLTILAFE